MPHFLPTSHPSKTPLFQHRAEACYEGKVNRILERVVFVAEAFIGAPVHALGLCPSLTLPERPQASPCGHGCDVRAVPPDPRRLHAARDRRAGSTCGKRRCPRHRSPQHACHTHGQGKGTSVFRRPCGRVLSSGGRGNFRPSIHHPRFCAGSGMMILSGNCCWKRKPLRGHTCLQ